MRLGCSTLLTNKLHSNIHGEVLGISANIQLTYAITWKLLFVFCFSVYYSDHTKLAKDRQKITPIILNKETNETYNKMTPQEIVMFYEHKCWYPQSTWNPFSQWQMKNSSISFSGLTFFFLLKCKPPSDFEFFYQMQGPYQHHNPQPELASQHFPE